jgi:hypothetical protein
MELTRRDALVAAAGGGGPARAGPSDEAGEV